MRFIEALGAIWKAPKSKPPQRFEETQNVYLTTSGEIHGDAPYVKSKELAELYVSNPWARTIVSKIANGVAKQRWFIEPPKGERVDKHEALDFIRRGCKGLRGRKAVSVTQTLLELQGECFWIIGRNPAGVAVEWAPIPSHWVIDTPSKSVNGYRIQPRSGVPFTLDAEHVIHFRDANPVDPYERGTSVARAAWADMKADSSASNMLAKYFDNDMRPALIVSGTEARPLDEKSVARAEESWRTKFLGANRKGRPWFSASKVEIKEIGTGLRDNAVPETRAMLRDNALQAWGLPPEIVGILKSSNRSTIDSADYFFAKHLLEPRLAFLLDELEAFCIDEFGIAPDTLRYESPIQDDVAQALEFVKARSTAFTDNEIRTWAKLKPAPGKDEFPEAPDPNAMGPNGPGGKPKPGKEPAKTFSAGVEKILTVDEVVSVSGAHEDPEVRANVTAMFEDIFAKLIVEFGETQMKILEAATDFEVTGAATEFLIREVPELIGYVDATTRKELAASLAEGSALNEDVAQLIKRVEGIFAEAGKLRASTIGDTVATKIAGYTTQIAGRQAGFERKKWLSTRDHKVRDTHRSLDRQIRRMDEPFVSPSGARAMHPGAFGKAAEDIHCRCAMRPVIEGEKAAELTDDEYEAKYEAARERLAKKMQKVAADVFRGQKAVVIEALKRVTQVRNPIYVM